MDDAEIDTVGHRAAASMSDRSVGRRPRSGVGPTRFATARSRSPASALTRGSVSGTSSTTRPARSAQPACTRHDLVEADLAAEPGCTAPVCSRLMSSRLPTSALSRSVSSSIVSRNSPCVGRVQSTSRCSSARHRRLDRRERCAQVVRHRGEERGAQLVRLGEPGRGRDVGTQPPPLDASASWRRTPAARPRSSSARSAPPYDSCRRPSRHASRRRLPARLGHRLTGRCFDDPRVPVCRKDGDRTQPNAERGAGRRAAAADPRRDERAAERASVSASAGPAPASACRRATTLTSQLDDAADDEEDEERERGSRPPRW